MAFRAPLLGYNTNVRHKGKLYHIQTEDSGVDHPHVITHLFADGGRIVGSKKTSYAERVGADGLQDIVKKLMQGQHKAMFISLRDGLYDEDASDDSDEQTGARPMSGSAQQALQGVTPAPVATPALEEPDPGAPEPLVLENDDDDEGITVPPVPRSSTPTPEPESAALSRPSTVFKAPKPEPEARPVAEPSAARRSLFGADVLSDKSLDEVILNYLAANEKDA